MWIGHAANYNHLKVFGCVVYYHVNEGKLTHQSKKRYFVGYPSGVKCYRIWSSKSRKCIISRDVKFYEVDLYKSLTKAANENSHQTEAERFDLKAQQDKIDANPGKNVMFLERELYDYNPLRERKTSKPTQRHGYADMISYALHAAEKIIQEDPINYKSQDKDKWILAMNEELKSLEKNNTWKLIPKPVNSRIVGNKGIFKRNEGIPRVEPPMLKARLVAKGFTQSMKEIEKLRSQLKKEFDMKDLGPTKRILRMKIIKIREQGKLTTSQESYIGKVLNRFNISESKVVNSRLAAHFKLSSAMSPNTNQEAEDMRNIPYASAIGSIMYAMVFSRPYISHIVSATSRFMGNPGMSHCWKTNLQHIVVLSTTEAEYVALAEAVKGRNLAEMIDH
ncbi:uncharacterized protein [Cicer arietinum]|uniref:uncharacterized protein n=1 Tax=Cicer arietinum TaxID=3827 RepID=UPI003CC5C1D1